MIQVPNYNVTGLLSRITVQGDADGSGIVDAADDDIWFHHIGAQFGGEIIGDLDHSGIVDAADEDIWFHHVGVTSTNSTWSVTERIVYDPYGQWHTLVADNNGTWHSDWSDYLAWN